MKTLVTGGGGFLGGAIVRRLLQKGFRVRSFSRGTYPELEALGVETMTGDLADAAATREACNGCELVFHVAAKAGIWGRREDFCRANVLGTQNVIQACRDAGISRLVYTSSPSVVFNGRDMEGANESVPYPSHFVAAYPETKAAAERLVLEANDDRMATVALRPHLVWGPRDTHLIPGILARSRQGRLRRIGKRPKLVDFTYIDNAAHAHLLAAERLEPGSKPSGKAYFISQAEPVPLWDFVDRVLQAADLPPAGRSIPPAVAYSAGWVCETVYQLFRIESDPPMTRFLARELATAHWFDITAARRDFGYAPPVSMEEGFRELEKWLASGELQ